MAEVNWIDAVLSAAVLLSAAFGLFRGLIRGVFGIISVIAAFFVARQYGGNAAAGVAAFLGDSGFAFALGYALAFAAALLLFSALTYLAHRAAAKADLGATDKFGGFIFGALRGVIFGALIVIVLSFLPLQNSAAWNESALLPMFGLAIQKTVSSSELSEYGRYWRFDEEHRPRLSLIETVAPNGVLANENSAQDGTATLLISENESQLQSPQDLSFLLRQAESCASGGECPEAVRELLPQVKECISGGECPEELKELLRESGALSQLLQPENKGE